MLCPTQKINMEKEQDSLSVCTEARTILPEGKLIGQHQATSQGAWVQPIIQQAIYQAPLFR